MPTPSDEVSEEQQIEQELQQIENSFGEIVEKHREALKEEEDIIKKIQLAEKVTDEMQEVTRLISEKSIERSEMHKETEQTIAHIVGLLQGVSMEISDLHSKLQKEDEEIVGLVELGSKIEDHSEHVLTVHEGAFGEQLDGDTVNRKSLDDIANRYANQNYERVESDFRDKIGFMEDRLGL